MEKYINGQSTDGSVKIADDVIAEIATVAAPRVNGVYYPNKDLMSEVTGVAGKLGVKTLAKGVRVAVGEGEETIDLSLSIKYGRSVLDTYNEAQEEVEESVKNMTGLSIVEIDVHVVGISAPISGFLAKA